MSPTDNGTSLSLRPFPISDTKPKNLGDFISRINTQTGGFRELSEDKLRQDIERQKSAPPEDQDVDMSDDQGDEQGDEDEDGNDAGDQDLMQGRMDVLQQVDIAANTAMLTLDSLSLLLSKQNPTQAGATLSKHLREIVGIGTLGADRLYDTNITPKREKVQEDISQGLTIMEINNTRDSAAAATEFLEKEVELEGRYWDEIIGVQKSGWSVCKMTQDKRILGVRFGFRESALEFRNNSLAPLRRGDNGSVVLDCNQLGDVSERLVVTYEKDGKIVGRSALRTQTEDNTTIEGQVLEARNALFSQELWHELTRESRTLAAYDVRAKDGWLEVALEDGSRVIIELLSVDSLPAADDFLPENDITQSISLVLQIMLSHAHRNNELMRTRPLPPHISRTRSPQHTYTLLRPILAQISHIRSTHECTKYVGAIVQTLKNAGLPASFTLSTAKPSLASSGGTGPNKPSDAQLLVHNFTQPIDFSIDLTVVENMPFTIRGRTLLYPFMGKNFHVVLPPSSPLETICPPYKEGYPDFAALRSTLCVTVSKIITEHFLSKLSGGPWIRSIKGMSICDSETEDSELQLLVTEDDERKPLLDVICTKIEDGRRLIKKWTWRGDNASPTMTLGSLVDQFTSRTLDLSDP